MDQTEGLVRGCIGLRQAYKSGAETGRASPTIETDPGPHPLPRTPAAHRRPDLSEEGQRGVGHHDVCPDTGETQRGSPTPASDPRHLRYPADVGLDTAAAQEKIGSDAVGVQSGVLGVGPPVALGTGVAGDGVGRG